MSYPGERTVIAPGPPLAHTPRILAGALRVVDAGPRLLYRTALVSLTGTALVAIAIALCVRPAGHLLKPQKELILAALAALFLAGLLVLAGLIRPADRRAAVLDRVVLPEQRAAIWLALAVWFPLVLIVVYFRACGTLPLSVVWISFGYLDKRWVTASYLLAALAPMLLLVTSARVLEAGRAHPDSWRSWLAGLAPRRHPPAQADPEGPASPPSPADAVRPRFRWARLVGVATSVLTAVGLAYYFYGPPWYLNRTAGSIGIGYQEDVFLSGFQAISKGAIPYIGPASIQYGPGAQLLSYLYMRHVAAFSVVGFRESWAMFQWAGASIFFVVFFLALGYGRGLAAALLSALIYPALQLIGFFPGRGYTGFFGWANPLRYAGAFALILLLPAVIKRAPSRRGLAGAAALGVLWGAFSYIAQENLIAGAVGALALAALLLFSGTSSWRSVRATLLAVLAGFIVSWLPALAYYTAKGQLARFVYLYFLITRAVAEGYSNTPYGGFRPSRGEAVTDAPWHTMYYALPFILAILALLAVVQFRPFRIAAEWSRERIVLAAVLLTTILMYQDALLRSDADHLAGTLLVVPALVVTAATVLPRLIGAHRRATLVLAGAAIVAASFLLLPYHAYKLASVRAEAEAPYIDRQRLAADLVLSAPRTVAGQRVGPGLVGTRLCCQHKAERMSQFLLLMNQIHAIVGDRTTYVVGFPNGYPGIVYFVANLTPAPVPIDLNTMVFTEPQRLAYLATFRRSVLPQTQALVTRYLSADEARYFLRRYPHARVITLRYRRNPYYVLLSSRRE
jgi:hypothetical protein